MSIPLLTSPTTQTLQFLVESQVNPMATLWNSLGSASAIAITGGAINGTPIGGTTPAAGSFTTINVSGTVTFGGTLDLSSTTLTLSNGQIAAAKISGLAPVATSGLYSDISGAPSFGSLASLSSVDTSHITNSAVTYAKIQNESANTILGSIAGGAPPQEIPCTSVARTLIAQTTQALMRTTGLGLGTVATLNVGTSANSIPQLDSSARLPAVDGSQLFNVTGVPVVNNALSGSVVMGAITVQWGYYTGGLGSPNVPFTTAFSNVPYSITCTSTANTIVMVNVLSKTASTFNARCIDTANNVTVAVNFYWMAIGPT